MATIRAVDAKLAVSKMRKSGLNMGSRVEYRGLKAYVRYYGRTKFAPGVWVGLELDQAVGDNNGTVGRVEYFNCRDYHGLFVKPSAVRVSKRRYKKQALATTGRRHLRRTGRSREASRMAGIMNQGISTHLVPQIEASRAEKRRRKRVERMRRKVRPPPARFYDEPELDDQATAHDLMRTYSVSYRRRLERRGQRKKGRRADARGAARPSRATADDLDYPYSDEEAEEAYHEEQDRLLQSMLSQSPQKIPFERMDDLRLPRLRQKYDRSLQPCSYHVGDRVETLMERVLFAHRGTVQYVGYIEQRPGLWIGVALDEALPPNIKVLSNFVGPHDGIIDNVFYFVVASQCGIFIRPSALDHLDADQIALEQAHKRHMDAMNAGASANLAAPDQRVSSYSLLSDSFSCETMSIADHHPIQDPNHVDPSYEYSYYSDDDQDAESVF